MRDTQAVSMMLYILFGEDDPARTHTRTERFAAHVEHLNRYAHRLLFSGLQVCDDGVTKKGMVFEFASQSEAESFLRHEPHCQAGLFKSLTFTRMNLARWHPERAIRASSGN
jgi:uncharacterized protein YciI